jgi:hypothetical protein
MFSDIFSSKDDPFILFLQDQFSDDFEKWKVQKAKKSEKIEPFDLDIACEKARQAVQRTVEQSYQKNKFHVIPFFYTTYLSWKVCIDHREVNKVDFKQIIFINMTNLVAVYRNNERYPISIHVSNHCMERECELIIVRLGNGLPPDIFTTVSDYDHYRVAPYDESSNNTIMMEFQLDFEYFDKTRYFGKVTN